MKKAIVSLILLAVFILPISASAQAVTLTEEQKTELIASITKQINELLVLLAEVRAKEALEQEEKESCDLALAEQKDALENLHAYQKETNDIIAERYGTSIANSVRLKVQKIINDREDGLKEVQRVLDISNRNVNETCK